MERGGAGHARVSVLQPQLPGGEDQPQWRGELRGGPGKALALLRLLEEQLWNHRAGEERLLAR